MTCIVLTSNVGIPNYVKCLLFHIRFQTDRFRNPVRSGSVFEDSRKPLLDLNFLNVEPKDRLELDTHTGSFNCSVTIFYLQRQMRCDYMRIHSKWKITLDIYVRHMEIMLFVMLRISWWYYVMISSDITLEIGFILFETRHHFIPHTRSNMLCVLGRTIITIVVL